MTTQKPELGNQRRKITQELQGNVSYITRGIFGKTLPKSTKQKQVKLVHSNHLEANGESKLDNYMPTLLKLASNPNSCIIKRNKHKFHTLFDSSVEITLVYTRVYCSLKE